jgi:hypothetical protein
MGRRGRPPGTGRPCSCAVRSEATATSHCNRQQRGLTHPVPTARGSSKAAMVDLVRSYSKRQDPDDLKRVEGVQDLPAVEA